MTPSNLKYTCTAGACRVIDFCLVSFYVRANVESFVAATDVPWRPHLTFRLTISVDFNAQLLRVFPLAPPLDRPTHAENPPGRRD